MFFFRRNLVNQGTKFQEQVGELTAEIEAREVESNKLHYQIDELQRDVCTKSSGMDRKYSKLTIIHIFYNMRWDRYNKYYCSVNTSVYFGTITVEIRGN